MLFNKIYKIILEQNKINNIEYVVPISNYQMGQIIASHLIINYNKNMNNDFNNLKKLLYDDQMKWFLYKIDDNIVACAACKHDLYWNSLYINQLFSFKKGYGAKLLLYLLKLNYNIIYLNSDWSQKESLNYYYRQTIFNLTEYIVDRQYYKVHYFYQNKKLNDIKLQQFIQEQFI